MQLGWEYELKKFHVGGNGALKKWQGKGSKYVCCPWYGYSVKLQIGMPLWENRRTAGAGAK